MSKPYRQVIIAILLLIAPSGARAQEPPWVPVPCADRPDEVRQLREGSGHKPIAAAFREHAHAVRSSEEGDPLYVPRPFPKTDEQVREDFKYSVIHRLFRDEDRLTGQERTFRHALLNGAYDIRVSSVQNWLPTQCSSFRPMHRYYLARAFDGDNEVARGAIHVTGVLGQFAFIESKRSSIVSLDELQNHLATYPDLDLKPQSAQYVVTDGLLDRCTPIMPCVAFRSHGTEYVLGHRDLLYELPGKGPTMTVKQSRQQVIESETLGLNRDRPHRPWLTVGFGWREARLVAGKLPTTDD